MRRRLHLVAAAGCVLVVAGCSSSGDPAPTFVPSPSGLPSEGPGVSISPVIPEAPGGGSGNGSGSGGSGSGGGSGSSSSPGAAKGDPDVVATNLTTPVGMAILPNNTALVAERTTGRIVVVQPEAGRPVTTARTISGLDTAGGGGLLDLALSPEYSQDNLIYAYLSTATDNRVVEFTLTGPVTPVLTGIPHGTSGNAGRIAFGADGDLYVATGDAGKPTSATDPTSLAGKVLRIDAIGKPAEGNPDPASAVYASGFQGGGLCAVPQTASLLEVEAGAGTAPGEVNLLRAGASYGYPTSIGGDLAPIATLPAAAGAPGGCAVLDNRIWLASPDGQEVLSGQLTPGSSGYTVGKFDTTLVKKYGRLENIVAASDGALWVTTTNRDGHGKPVKTDERVIRFMPSGSDQSGSSQA